MVWKSNIKNSSFIHIFIWTYSTGDALITIATGYLSDAEVDSLGLVSTHAYAVLGNL